MPFTAARNQLLDVISAFSMSSFPWRVGCDAVHTLITFFCISIILFHLSSIIMSFPTHEPEFSWVRHLLLGRHIWVFCLCLYQGFFFFLFCFFFWGSLLEVLLFFFFHIKLCCRCSTE